MLHLRLDKLDHVILMLSSLLYHREELRLPKAGSAQKRSISKHVTSCEASPRLPLILSVAQNRYYDTDCQQVWIKKIRHDT